MTDSKSQRFVFVKYGVCFCHCSFTVNITEGLYIAMALNRNGNQKVMMYFQKTECGAFMLSAFRVSNLTV